MLALNPGDTAMKRLLPALAALLLLSGCATYGDGYYQGREVYRDGGYYYPAYDGEGDYYYGEDYDDYRYDSGYGVGYGYGYAPFHGLDRYRCRSYYGCAPVWGGYYPYSYSPGWSFSFGNYWSWNNWGWYGGYRSRDYYRDYYRDREREREYERERVRQGYPDREGVRSRPKPDPGLRYPRYPQRIPESQDVRPRPSMGGEPVRPPVRRTPEAGVRPMPSTGGEGVQPAYPGVRTKPAVEPVRGSEPLPRPGVRYRYTEPRDDARPAPRAMPQRYAEPAPRPEPRRYAEPAPRQQYRAPAPVRPAPAAAGGPQMRYPSARPAPEARPQPAPKPAPAPRVRTTSQNETSDVER